MGYESVSGGRKLLMRLRYSVFLKTAVVPVLLLLSLVAISAYRASGGGAQVRTSHAPLHRQATAPPVRTGTIQLPRVQMERIPRTGESGDAEPLPSSKNPFVFERSNKKIVPAQQTVAQRVTKPLHTVEYQGCLFGEGRKLALIKVYHEIGVFEEGAKLAAELTLVRIDPSEIVVVEADGRFHGLRLGGGSNLVPSTQLAPTDAEVLYWSDEGSEIPEAREAAESPVPFDAFGEPFEARESPDVEGDETEVRGGQAPRVVSQGALALEPGVIVTVRGGRFEVALTISEAERIDSLTATLLYDPSIMSIQEDDVQGGDFLIRWGGPRTFYKKIDTDARSITIGISWSGISEVVSGSGTVVTLPFEAIAEGSARIILASASLVDTEGRGVPVAAGVTARVAVTAGLMPQSSPSNP